MGLIATGNTVEMMVYLTDAGREALLRQGFSPVSFSLTDEDANYNATDTLIQVAPDLTGDYNDNVYSTSKNIGIKNQIIYNIPTATIRTTTATTTTASANLVTIRSTAAIA
jgi:hypothetical protein